MRHSYREFWSALSGRPQNQANLSVSNQVVCSKCSGIRPRTYLYIEIRLCTSAQLRGIASCFQVSPPGIRIHFAHFLFLSLQLQVRSVRSAQTHTWNRTYGRPKLLFQFQCVLCVLSKGPPAPLRSPPTLILSRPRSVPRTLNFSSPVP